MSLNMVMITFLHVFNASNSKILHFYEKYHILSGNK